MTNYEKLCRDSETLAKFLSHAFPGCRECPIKDFCTAHGEINTCEGTFKEWLDSEAETTEVIDSDQ